MKYASLLLVLSIGLFYGCKKDKESSTIVPLGGGSAGITGTISPMSAVGETVASSSTTISGVTGFNAAVKSVTNDVSTYSGSAIVTNPAIVSLFTSVAGIYASGDTVYTDSLNIKQTVEGIELKTGSTAGILVKYSSEVGDSYPIASGGTRAVVRKDSQDSYSWGGMLIKVMEVQETPNILLKSAGISKISYFANHRFGLVGFQVTFSDQSTALFPVYSSTQNN